MVTSRGSKAEGRGDAAVICFSLLKLELRDLYYLCES
jgi:hypothetical protein